MLHAMLDALCPAAALLRLDGELQFVHLKCAAEHCYFRHDILDLSQTFWPLNPCTHLACMEAIFPPSMRSPPLGSSPFCPIHSQPH